jgi:hypothetical protein
VGVGVRSRGGAGHAAAGGGGSTGTEDARQVVLEAPVRPALGVRLLKKWGGLPTVLARRAGAAPQERESGRWVSLPPQLRLHRPTKW